MAYIFIRLLYLKMKHFGFRFHDHSSKYLQYDKNQYFSTGAFFGGVASGDWQKGELHHIKSDATYTQVVTKMQHQSSHLR